MQLVSFCYQQVVALRNGLFDQGFLPIYHSTKPVVSIGNIAAGGTGKTSLTELIARKVGRPVAILERGYKSAVTLDEPFIVTSPLEGDEAFMLASKLPFAKVIVGKKRVESAKFAETLDVDYILMDDGMQHRYLHRDIEIVVLHREGGFLRESLTSLIRADYVVINGVRKEEEVAFLQKYTDAPLIGVAYEVLNGEEFCNRKVSAFCGIGKPEPFYALLEEMGCHIVTKKTLSDHAKFEGVEEFIEEALEKGAEKIVCTEKDFIKLSAGVSPLKVALKVQFGEKHLEKMLERLSDLF